MSAARPVTRDGPGDVAGGYRRRTKKVRPSVSHPTVHRNKMAGTSFIALETLL